MYGFKPQHAQGKPVQKYANGGKASQRGFVKGEGTATSDSIPARLSTGEYVLPADTVKAVGVDTLDALRAATHNPVPNEQAKAARGFFAGGTPGGVDEDWQRQMEGQRSARTQEANSIASEAMAQSQAESDKLAAQSSRPAAPIGGLANNGGANGSVAPFGSKGLNELRNLIPQMEAMGYAQSPAAAPAPVAAPVANIQTGQPRSVSPSALYMQDRAQDLKGQVGQGNYAQAAGTAARTAVQGLGMYGIELADNAGTPLINAARGFGSGLLGSDANATPATPSTIASPPTSQTNPAAAPASTSLANAGRGVVNPPTINPSAPAPSNAPAAALTGNEIMPGVFKHGRGQYSDQATGMGMPAGFTGQPSAQNSAAWQRLADRSQQESMSRVSAQQPAGFAPSGMTAPTVRHSGNDWQARNELRNALVSASSITNNGGKWDNHGKGNVSPERAQYLAMLGTDQALRQSQPGADVAAMRENAGIQREGMQQTGETARTGMREQGANTRDAGRTALARDEFGLRKDASGFQTRAAKRLEDLQNSYQSAKTPEERASIAQQLRELQVKDAPTRMQTVTLPDTTNEMGQVVRGGQALVRELKDGSVQQVPIGAQQGAALPPGMKRQIGTSNGRPVYEDMNGKQVIAKG